MVDPINQKEMEGPPETLALFLSQVVVAMWGGRRKRLSKSETTAPGIKRTAFPPAQLWRKRRVDDGRGWVGGTSREGRRVDQTRSPPKWSQLCAPPPWVDQDGRAPSQVWKGRGDNYGKAFPAVVQ